MKENRKMGIFTGIKTLITGSNRGLNIAEKSANGIIAGIDKMVFTKEEKFDAWKDVAKVHLEIVKQAAQESSSKSMTRRLLALVLIGDYCFLTTFAAIVWKFDTAWALKIVEIANNTNLGKLALWFGIFYVVYYGVSTVIDHVKDKK